MPRPQKSRIVKQPPLFVFFKPAGVASRKLEKIVLQLDEYEAIRLADYMGLDHEGGAEMMEISRSTFTRLLEGARKKVAAMLIEGKALSVSTGEIHFSENLFQCQSCGEIFSAEFSDTSHHCPSCLSEDVLNHAEHFGHGRCCGEFIKSKKRRRSCQEETEQDLSDKEQ